MGSRMQRLEERVSRIERTLTELSEIMEEADVPRSVEIQATDGKLCVLLGVAPSGATGLAIFGRDGEVLADLPRGFASEANPV